MVREPMTLEEIWASRPDVDRAKVAATTEDDIRRQQVEDGENPDLPLPPYEGAPDARAIRLRLRLDEQDFARALGVPVATVRAWEDARVKLDPAVRSLLLVLDREPEAALRALAG